jgi:hypothetical protein
VQRPDPLMSIPKQNPHSIVGELTRLNLIGQP